VYAVLPDPDSPLGGPFVGEEPVAPRRVIFVPVVEAWTGEIQSVPTWVVTGRMYIVPKVYPKDSRAGVYRTLNNPIPRSGSRFGLRV
jgi:hypothetical protein